MSVILAQVMMLTVMPMNVFAAESTSGTCGENLTWTFNTETGVLTIDGTGKMTNYDAFIGCGNLEEVTLPEGLTKIGDSAFRDCANLKDIEIPATVKTLGHYAFYGCTGLTDVNISDGVTTIGNYALQILNYSVGKIDKF